MGAEMWEIFCHKGHVYGGDEKAEDGATCAP